MMDAVAIPVPASLSSAERAHVCPGSTVLDRVDSLGGESGSAIHEALAVLVEDGRVVADCELPAILERWNIEEREGGFIRAKIAKFSPQVPKHDDGEDVTPALCEVALCMLEDRSVVEVVGARGRYVMPAGGVIPGSIDVMWSEPEPLRFEACPACDGALVKAVATHAPRVPPERCAACNDFGRRVVCPPGSTLWLADWKSGADRNVPRAERNRQIRWGASFAARWTGAERVVSAIVYVEGTEGRWDYRQHPPAWNGAPALPHPYARAELTAIEDEILADHARWQEQARRREAGEALELVTGGHCEYCPSRAYCPAHVQPARALVASDVTRLVRGPLTQEERRMLALWLPTAKKVIDDAESLLKADVEARGPIPLPDGRVYGPHVMPWTKKAFSTRETYEVLAAEIGPDGADLAFVTSKDAIEGAIAAAHAEQGIKRQVSPTFRRVLAKLYEAGAIREEPVVHVHAHHPTAALAAAQEPASERKTGT